MAYYFGAGMATDAFVTAFRIPNLLRDMFAEGALSSAFVPVFKDKLVQNDRAEAFALANVVLGVLLLVVGAIVALGIVASPAIIYVTANGFTEDMDKFHLTVDLTRIMFVYLLLVSLAALVMGMLNSFGRFGIPAVSPALFNTGIILAVIIMYRWFDQPAYTLAIGVVIGGIAQLGIQVPPLIKLGFKVRPRVNFFDPAFQRIMGLIGPMIAGMSAGRVNILLSTLLASFLIEGAISYLNYAYRLMHFPLGVFAVALGTVALPKASELASRKDTEGLGRSFTQTLNLNMLVVVPSAVFLVVIGYRVVDLLYNWGAFTDTDAANTALTLAHYSYGLIGFAGVRVVVPYYYACSDSKRPMKFSIISVLVNMALYWPMIELLSFAGLAAATSIGGLVNFGLLLWFVGEHRIVIDWRRFAVNLTKIVAASLVAFVAAVAIPDFWPDAWPGLVHRIVDLAAPMLIGGLLYFVICLLLRVDELDKLVNKLLRR